MLGESHELTEEFPEFKDRIAELRSHDEHFAELCGEYERINKEVIHIENESVNTSDFYWENLKKRRLKLKDELYVMLRD